MHPSALRQKIRDLVEPGVQRLGFDLVAVELVGGARRPVLRLSIDRPGGVGADDCARVSVRISPLFDEADPIEGAYDLEVSSPGIERPVQRLADFRRFAGYRVRIRMEEGLPRRRYTGTILAVDEDDVLLEVDGQEHRLPFGGIDAAHLVLDLDAYKTLAEGLPPIPGEDPAQAEDAAVDTAGAQEDTP